MTQETNDVVTQELIERLEPCPFCGTVPERLKNLDFSDSEAFWHPDNVDCILSGCSIHRDKWEGWNTRDQSQSARIAERPKALDELFYWHDQCMTRSHVSGFESASFRSAWRELNIRVVRCASLTKDSTSVTG